MHSIWLPLTPLIFLLHHVYTLLIRDLVCIVIYSTIPSGSDEIMVIKKTIISMRCRDSETQIKHKEGVSYERIGTNNS